ncbi:MAG: methyltransferase domain-containing protein [Candidatus Omnitrophica bacterium]|nr:methyltransferase domain-containing protein [Candidatus Omnitrophota bacterium]
MEQWYESLFENYAEKYDKECFVQGTVGECDFIEEEIRRDRSLEIIDIGCGTGRHSIELAKRGYNVTGIDLSGAQLKRGREKAKEVGVKVVFEKHDARDLPFERQFDLAIMLCEGAFPLMETDEMNYGILKNATKVLKDNGKLIFTTLNALFPLYHNVEQFCVKAGDKESATYRSNTFDLMTFRDHHTVVFEDDLGNKKELKCNERYYAPSEITWLLKSLGFKAIDIFGARLGAFSREDNLTTEDFEMLVVANR